MQKKEPKAFIVEEVKGFDTMNPKTSKTWLGGLIEKAAEHGHVGQSVQMDSRHWVEVPRPRFYIIGISKQLGNEASLQNICQMLEEVQVVRSQTPSVPLFSKTQDHVLDMSAPALAHRRLAAKASRAE